MGKLKERLLEIDEEIAEIVALPADECHPDMDRRHDELVRERQALSDF